MRYLLDTTVLIDFSKRREPAFSLVHRLIADGDELGVCPINVAEFYAGLRPQDLPTWDEFFEPLLFWPISRIAAQQAGRFRHDFARQGIQLSTTDMLVAAVAVEQGALLMTSNVKDYPMPEIRLLPLIQAQP